MLLQYQIRRFLIGTLLIIVFNVPVRASDYYASFMLGVSSLDSTLSVYQLDSLGAVRQQGFYPTIKNPKAVAIHPAGKFAYVVAKTANKLASYEVVNISGRVELQNPKYYDIPAVSPFSLVVHPTGKYLYVAAREGKIAAYSINLSNGELIPVSSSPYKSQYRTRSLLVHNSGKFLYAVNAYANSISAYRIDTVSGDLSPLPYAPFAVTNPKVQIRSLWPLADVPPGAGGIPYYVAMEPQGRFLYVSVWGAGIISAFSIDQQTGALSELPGSPFNTGLNPYALAVHPSGRYLYAGSWQTNSLWAYAIDSQTGALTGLTQKSFVTGGHSPVSIVFNAAGTMAYVANAESASISALQVDSDTGELSLLHTTQTRPGPWWLTPPERSATKPPDLNLYVYKKNSKRLSLTRLEGNVAQRVDSIALPADGVWAIQERLDTVYAADMENKSIIGFRLDESKRRFVRIDQSPWTTPGAPVDMKIDVNGWYVYVLTKEPNLILAFGIDSTTGALFPVPQPAALRFVPGELVLDAAARYAYVFGAEGRQVSLFSYRQNTGPLLYERTRFGSPFALKQASSTALIDPGANFILTAGRSRNALGVHKIDAISGAIKEITSSPFHLSADITKTVVHHSGKYVYVFDQAAAKLFTYSRDAISGEINTMHTSFLDLSNQNISAITIHKNFSYLVDDSTNKLLIYSVDPGSGALHRFMQVQLSSKADSIVVTPAY